MRFFWLPVLFSSACGLAAPAAQPADTNRMCPDRVALFPAGDGIGGANTKAPRFELRTCNGLIQVLLFEADSAKPAVFLDTLDRWTTLFHSHNVLVMQMIGGSSSPVYVFRFRNGKAMQPVSADTRGTVRAGVDEENAAVNIEIPPAQTHKEPLRYAFPIEFVFPGSRVR